MANLGWPLGAGAPLEVEDAFAHQCGVDLVDFLAAANAAQQGDGQFAAEVLAEFLEAVEQESVSAWPGLRHERVEDREAELLDEREHAFCGRARKNALPAAVENVQRHAECDGRAEPSSNGSPEPAMCST